jgi:pimeloyl-ACP methyl ester carboxylesterase
MSMVDAAVGAATISVGDVPVSVVRRGSGSPLLVLHDELGHPGWMSWNEALSGQRELIVPLQPAYGDTPKVDWIRGYRDLASFYARMVREQGWGPIDVIGFSAGGFTAAEMTAACPDMVRRLVLVAPLGCRPLEGEIFDFLAVTVRTHVAATVSRQDAPEFGQIYGGDMTPEQFERFEDARAETARLGWQPFMFDDSLPHRLEGIGQLPTLIVWGDDDLIAPRGCVDAYDRAIPNSEVVVLPGAGHRPEIEDPEGFLSAVTAFLGR